MIATRRILALLASLALALVVPSCGDNILDNTETERMCLIEALTNCEAQINCGFIDGLEAASCPGELFHLCCAEHDDCVGTLPITMAERFVCIDYILATDCAVIEEETISIERCLGW